MIKNPRQHRVTREQRALLTQALDRARAAPNQDAFVKAHIMSLVVDIETLDQELDQYARLLKGHLDDAALQKIPSIGEALIRARLAARITHKELARRLGKKEQAIQRWEAGNYASASLKTITQIAKVLQHARHEEAA